VSDTQVYPTPRDAAEHCGDFILQLLKEALANQPAATLAISGGSTPRPMFEHMAKARFDWSRVHLFWVDERAVPPTDSQSNYRLADETLIRAAQIPGANLHRVQAELDPAEAARLYSEEIRSFFALDAAVMPQFDVIHRGIGPDAHTASLFPGEPLIDDRENLVAAVYVEKMNSSRITMLPGVLLAAKHTAMLVCGADKVDAVGHIFHDKLDARKYPAQALSHPPGGITWFFDVPAAAPLES